MKNILIVLGFFFLLGSIMKACGIGGDSFTTYVKSSLAESLISGNADDRDWNAYNELLNEKVILCVSQNGGENARSGAWNPDSIGVDYSSSQPFNDFVKENNREIDPSFSGSVVVSGTNAYGAVIKSRVEAYGIIKLTQIDGEYLLLCY